MKKLNNKGSILLITTMVLYLVIVLAVNFSMVNINEMNYSRHYYHSAAAFWLAEAGINKYMADPSILNEQTSKEINYGNGTILLTRDDSKPLFRYINSIGIYGKDKRKIQIAYRANVPNAYKNTLSTQGNITVNGSKSYAVVNGKTRLSGVINGNSLDSYVILDDGLQNVDPRLTTLNYSETSDSDAKRNFINNNKSLMESYPPDQVLHITDTDSYTLTPEAVAGKRIIYVEGSSGSADVTINSNGIVAANQSITVIATGKVTFNQKGRQANNSQLNIIAWGGYNETVSETSTYRGLIYTHGIANFSEIKADSVSNGGVIADGGIIFGDIWSTKIFNFADMTRNGSYPPGFETLAGGSTMGIADKPISWREITL